VPAIAFGGLAVACTWAWLWQADRDPGLRVAEVGAGVRIPVGATGHRSHSWWATVILLVVDLTVLAAMAFAHVHVALRADTCPPPGAALPSAAALLWVSAGWAASSSLLWFGSRRIEQQGLGRTRSLLWIGSAVLAIAAFAALCWAHADAGLLPRAQAWSASVAALLGYLGLHVVAVLMLALFVVARAWHGLVTPRQRASVDNAALLWHGACAQGVLVAWLPHLVTWSLRP
jgi:cytochrome c oxidase subunit I+III